MPKPQRTRVKSTVVTNAPTAAELRKTRADGTSQNSIMNATKRTTIGKILKMMSCLKSTRRYLFFSSMLVVVKERPISSGPQKNSMVKAMIFGR